MPKSISERSTPPIAKSQRRSNVSLPDDGTPLESLPTTSRRNTVTEESASKPRKKTKSAATLAIPEDDTNQARRIASVIVPETKKHNRTDMLTSDSLATPLSKSKRKSNISLPENTTSHDNLSTVSRRSIITEEGMIKTRNKSKPSFTPTIPEDGTDPVITFVSENEDKKLNRRGSDVLRKSPIRNKSAKVTYSYDNKAYDWKLPESQSDSIRTSSRANSVQSLEIYREQYCCCAKRTKCERYLLVTVTVLVTIIIVLVIVIAVLAKNNKLNTIFKL